MPIKFISIKQRNKEALNKVIKSFPYSIKRAGGFFMRDRKNIIIIVTTLMIGAVCIMGLDLFF